MFLIELDEIYLMVGEFGGKIQILNFSDFSKIIFCPHMLTSVSNCPISELIQAIGDPNIPAKFDQNRFRIATCSDVTDRQTDRQTDGHDDYISPFFS